MKKGVKKGTAQPDAALAKRIGFETANRHPDVIKSHVFEAKVEDALCGPIFSEVGKRCASYLNIPPDEIAPLPGSPSPLVAAGGSH